MTRPAPSPGIRPGGSTARPGLGAMRPQPPSRPTTIPGQAVRPGGTFAGRPSTKPAFPTPHSPGRPVGGGRPSLGTTQRPTTLPGRLPDGVAGNRPSIGGDRPAIGDGNTFWNNGAIGSGNIGSGNWGNANNTINNVNVGGWGLSGYGHGYGGWANHWNAGYVNPHYGGWYNGCWGGNWGYNGGWWAPFAAGAATWGLASTLGSWGWGYGAAGYVNPYYSAVPAAVVAASPYDYAQPVVVNNYVTNDGDLTDADTVQGATAASQSTTSASPSDVAFDAAIAAFKRGDYATALTGCDKAITLVPNDSVIHEVRALALFALGRYAEAAATLNAVLAVAPGMDWTTMGGLYGSVDTYEQQLRKLEDFCREHPGDAAASFVLAYHYLVGGHVEMAADALRVVVAKQPNDAVAKRILEAIDSQPPPAPAGSPPAVGPDPAKAPAAATAAGPQTDLVGSWKATSGNDSVDLVILEDSHFTWTASPAGGQPVQIAGTIETSRDAIALVSESVGTMAGKVVARGPDAFDFTLVGAPPNAAAISFHRVKL